MRINLFRRKNNRGIGLVEIVAALAIIGLIVAGALTLLGRAQNSSQFNDAITGLASVYSGVKDIYYGQSYADLSSADLIATNMVPSRMISGSNLRNPFGGAINLAPENIDSGVANGFSITYTGVPRDVCVTLLSRNLGLDVVQVQVGTTAFAGTPSVSQASAACGTGPSLVEITWVFL